MEIIKNGFVTQNGAYYNSGGLVNDSQRITSNHVMDYWQQGNITTNLAINKNEILKLIKIEKALYVGRIPLHFGHFIIEGLARLCDAANFDIPIIGYLTTGFLPEGILTTPIDDIRWVINSVTNQYFYEITDSETYQIETLYVPKLPIILSQSCSEPWRFTPIIKKIVTSALELYPDDFRQIANPTKIEKLYLRRYEEMNKCNIEPSIYNRESNPTDSLAKQISYVCRADTLLGVMGSNTHLSIFAKSNVKTIWTHRGDLNTYRNQLICDLIKTYNING